MKKFILGLICGLVISTSIAFAAQYMAEPSHQTFYVNGNWERLEAYSIHDNNFVKVRDIAKYVDFGVNYDEKTDSVYIDTKSAYVPAGVAPTPPPQNTNGRPSDPQAEARKSLQPFIATISGLSEKAKCQKIADYLCDKFEYGEPDIHDADYYIENIFKTPKLLHQVCAGYTETFKFICDTANIKCITASGGNHAWCEVYVDGKWQIMDVTWYDGTKDSKWIFTDYSHYEKQDEDPQRTAERKAKFK